MSVGAIINTKYISWKRNREFNIYLIVNSRTVPTNPSGKVYEVRVIQGKLSFKVFKAITITSAVLRDVTRRILPEVN